MTTNVATVAEDMVATLSEALTRPGERECLTCYLSRMLDAFGCDNRLRWAEHWRDRNAPQATALARRLQQRGGYCDCEVMLNVYPQLLLEEDEPQPPCLGVSRRGSTRPCQLPARPRPAVNP